VEVLTVFLVNGGLAILSNRVLGAGTEPKNMGWGTGAGAASAASTALSTEKLVDLTTSAGTDHTVGTSSQQTTTQTNDTYQVLATRTATGAGTVTNLGLFDAASGGNLFIIVDGQSVLLASGDSIAATWKLKFA
jgi:hypothetical protein